MDSLKKYVLACLALGSLASLAYVFRSFLIANLIQPVAFLFWAVWRILSSVNQNIYWTILIVVCVIFVTRLVPRENDNGPNMAYTYEYRSPNAVEYWRTLIKDAILGRNEVEHLRDGLRKLLRSVIENAERSEQADSDEIAVIGKMPMSAAAFRFLFPPAGHSRIFSISRLFEFPNLAPRWLRRWARIFMRQDTDLIDEILRCMETEMEVRYD